MDRERKNETSPSTPDMAGLRARTLPAEPDFDDFIDSPPSTPSVKSSASTDASRMPRTISPHQPKSRNAKSLRDLSGTWTLSKPLSTGIPPALEIQGFTSPARKAIIASPLRLAITQSHFPSQIFVTQHTTSSIPAFTQRLYPPQRVGVWSGWWESVTEKTRMRCRWTRELREGMRFLTEGLGRAEEYLECEVECKLQGWLRMEVWVVEGARRLVRRVVTLGVGKDGFDGRRAETRLVYEFEGP